MIKVLAVKIPVHMPLGWFGETNPEVLCNRIRLREAFEKVLRTLSPRQAKIIRLHYFDGYTVTEIARIMRVSPERIHWLRGEALLRLRRRERAKFLRKFI